MHSLSPDQVQRLYPRTTLHLADKTTASCTNRGGSAGGEPTHLGEHFYQAQPGGKPQLCQVSYRASSNHEHKEVFCHLRYILQILKDNHHLTENLETTSSVQLAASPH